jgi:hypothetical protein
VGVGEHNDTGGLGEVQVVLCESDRGEEAKANEEVWADEEGGRGGDGRRSDVGDITSEPAPAVISRALGLCGG